MGNRRPELKLIAPDASREEAAAVIAAVQRFLRDTAPPPAPIAAGPAAWVRAARLQAVGERGRPSPWGTAHPWA